MSFLDKANFQTLLSGEFHLRAKLGILRFVFKVE